MLSEIVVTVEDFQNCEWKIALAACSEKTCEQYHKQFLQLAKHAQEEKDQKCAFVFSLLEAVTSLMLQPDAKDEPFAPLAVMQTWRSAILNDFTDEQLTVFASVINDIADAELQARLADVLWLRKRSYTMGILAVDAYLSTAQNLTTHEHWLYIEQRLHRAIQIAASLGKSNTPYQKVLRYIEDQIDRYPNGDATLFTARLHQILYDYREGDPLHFALLAGKSAQLTAEKQNWLFARNYWEIQANWYSLANDPAKQRLALIDAAETHVREAECWLRQNPINYSVAAWHLKDAHEAYKRLGNARERMEELYRQILVFQQSSVDELKGFSKEVDLTQISLKAKERVKGKSFIDALLTLARMGSSPKLSDLRQQVQEAYRSTPLQYIISMSKLDSSGKVIARRPSMLSNDAEEAEAATRAEMLRLAILSQELHAMGVVIPARNQIENEHYFTIEDFYPIVANNPFVPPGHIFSYARALYAGLKGDLLISANLLLPQLENSIRYLLIQNDVITSGLTAEQIQQEFTLNKIIYRPEMKGIFGEDLTFDLQGLLVEAFGSNYRNLAAHGLIEDHGFYAPRLFYLWWLALRLCCWPLMLSIDKGDEVTAGECKDPDKESSDLK